MLEKTYITLLGTIHYWVHMIDTDIATLVFLPGLTADHRLFEKQIEYLENRYDLSESCVHLKTGEIINYEEYQNIKGE